MARERGLTVDVAEFEKLMEEQRARARAAQKKQAKKSVLNMTFECNGIRWIRSSRNRCAIARYHCRR